MLKVTLDILKIQLNIDKKIKFISNSEYIILSNDIQELEINI